MCFANAVSVPTDNALIGKRTFENKNTSDKFYKK